jgi:hypothetical protein
MADAELIRHQQIWKGFTTFMKLGIAGVTLLLIMLALTLL